MTETQNGMASPQASETGIQGPQSEKRETGEASFRERRPGARRPLKPFMPLVDGWIGGGGSVTSPGVHGSLHTGSNHSPKRLFSLQIKRAGLHSRPCRTLKAERAVPVLEAITKIWGRGWRDSSEVQSTCRGHGFGSQCPPPGVA